MCRYFYIILHGVCTVLAIGQWKTWAWIVQGFSLIVFVIYMSRYYIISLIFFKKRSQALIIKYLVSRMKLIVTVNIVNILHSNNAINCIICADLQMHNSLIYIKCIVTIMHEKCFGNIDAILWSTGYFKSHLMQKKKKKLIVPSML